VMTTAGQNRERQNPIVSWGQQPVGMIREPFFGYHQGQRQNVALTGRTHDRTQTGKKQRNFPLAKTEPSTHDNFG